MSDVHNTAQTATTAGTWASSCLTTRRWTSRVCARWALVARSCGGRMSCAMCACGGRRAVKRGDRVAQLIVERIATPEVAEVADLDATVRGDGGFGSTGVGAPEKRMRTDA